MKIILLLLPLLLSGCKSCTKFCVDWEDTPTGKECIRDGFESYDCSGFKFDYEGNLSYKNERCTKYVCYEYAPCFKCLVAVEREKAPVEKIPAPEGRLCPGAFVE